MPSCMSLRQSDIQTKKLNKDHRLDYIYIDMYYHNGLVI